jgi:hypothetical protein
MTQAKPRFTTIEDYLNPIPAVLHHRWRSRDRISRSWTVKRRLDLKNFRPYCKCCAMQSSHGEKPRCKAQDSRFSQV